MQRFLGRSTAAPASERKPRQAQTDDTVLTELVESRELVEKRMEHLQRKLQMEIEQAVAHKNANQKKLAIGCLKRKKMIEAEIDSLIEQRFKLDSHELTLQSLRFTENTFAVERRATQAIRDRLRAMGGADAVEESRAETEEAFEDAYEILGIAAQTISHPALGGADDEELLAELIQMEEEQAQDDAANELSYVELGGSSSSQPYLRLPDVAKTLPSRQQRDKKQQEEERELAELEKLTATMAIEQPMPMLGAAATMVVEPPMPMLGLAAPRMITACA